MDRARVLEQEMRESGFLAPGIRLVTDEIRLAMSKELDLLRDLNRLAIDMAMKGAALSIGLSTMEPKVLGTLAMMRSLENYQAAVLLIERGMTVEPRILARCIYENAFCIGAAHKQPEEFALALKSDSNASKLAQAKLLMKQQDSMDAESVSKVKEHLDAAGQGHKTLNISKIAEHAGYESFYLYYRVLSAEVMHLSADSLLRHIDIAEGNTWKGFKLAFISDNELRDAVFYLSNSAMCLILAFNDLLDTDEFDGEISSIWQRVLSTVFRT